MQTIDAIYSGGKFEPLQATGLSENQQVRIVVLSSETQAALDWFAEAEAAAQDLEAKFGILPDSAPDIAADRANHG